MKLAAAPVLTAVLHLLATGCGGTRTVVRTVSVAMPATASASVAIVRNGKRITLGVTLSGRAVG